MVNYAKIQHHIDKGLGLAAKKLGPPFEVYRIGATSTGDFPDAWDVVATNYPLFRRRISDRKLESGLIGGSMVWYDIISNMEPFLLGDVFVSQDPDYDPGQSYGRGATSTPDSIEMNALSLAWHAPVRKPTGARITIRARIYRPAAAPAILGDGSHYWKETLDNDSPLVLTDGVYDWGTPGTQGSLIPVGISSSERLLRGYMFPPQIPGSMTIPRYFAYVPPLPGYAPIEGDAIVLEDDTRYLVSHPFNQTVGLVGSQLALERTASQAP